MNRRSKVFLLKQKERSESIILSVAGKFQKFIVALSGAESTDQDGFGRKYNPNACEVSNLRNLPRNGGYIRLGNFCPYDVSEMRMSALNDIMEALTDANISTVGVYPSAGANMGHLLDIVLRRAKRDNLFDVVLTASVTRKPDFKKVQKQIADALGLRLVDKGVAKRASRLCERLKKETTVLVILRDLHKGLCLRQLGIPFGADHTGCKILLTSTSRVVLSDQMEIQRVILLE